MALFSQKTDTVKVDAIVNNYLRRLVDASAAPALISQSQTAAGFSSAQTQFNPPPAIGQAALSQVWS